MKKILHSLIMVAAIIVLGLAQSCQKYPDTPPTFEPIDSISAVKDRRVLIIAIDGLQSDAFKTAATPNYTALMENGKYTWDAKSDVISKDGSAWKTLTSGVTYSSHAISDSNFTPPSQGTPGQHGTGGSTATTFQSFYYFILRSRIFNASTVMLSSWNTMVEKVGNEAKIKGVLANDAAVKDSAISILKNSHPKVMTINFNGPAKLAVNPSNAATFSSGSTDYVNSLKTIDGYIGEIMAALKARPLYNSVEDWLVVITGTHGGINKTYGGTSDAETNVPTLYYNKNFKKVEFTKEGSYSAVRVNMAANINASAPDADGAYNIKTAGNPFTIQFKYKGTASDYVQFFSKWDGIWSSTTGNGWSFYWDDDRRWGFSIRDLSGRQTNIQDKGVGPVGFDDQWHTFTVAIYDSAGKRWVKRFTDNVRLGAPRDISAFGNISANAPVTIGVPKDPIRVASNFNISDIAIFNTALDDATITANLCLQDYTKHPKFSNIIGYWPANDGIGSLMANKVNSNKNFTLSGPFSWGLQTSFPCSFLPTAPAGKKTLYLKNIDISAQVFYWLELPVPTTWPLEGSIWLTPYESEFIKI